VLGVSLDHVLGRSLEAAIGAIQCDAFRAFISQDDLGKAAPIRFRIGADAQEMDCSAHRQGGVLIVELEFVRGARSLEPVDLWAHLQVPLSRIEQAPDIAALSESVVHDIRRLTGFDRVVFYRFDETWAGQVIAEATSLPPWLGLRFPASDVPPQARRLFLVNRLRAIADAAAPGVPIVSEGGTPDPVPLDLTYSHLRSAAPVHLEYLRNMGTQASMTVSVIVQHQLWGMITCHHRSPLRLDAATRAICAVVGLGLNSKVAVLAENAALQERLIAHQLLEDYLESRERKSSHGAPLQPKRLLKLFDADGLIFSLGGVITLEGTTVAEEFLRPVIAKLKALSMRGIASSNKLATLDPSASRYESRVSGALFIGLTHASGDFVLLLRRELMETVEWAGNPAKDLIVDDRGNMHPRASFASWKETVRGRSRRWTEAQLECARFFREQLLRLVELQRLRELQRS